MCLYPRTIVNKKYTPTKKNNGNVPRCHDERQIYVTIGCGKCIECKKKKAREWRIRLYEEFISSGKGTFVTMTIDDKKCKHIMEELGEEALSYNAIKEMVGRFFDNHRKKTGKTLKRWMITERGENGTKRLHLHGIIFEKKELIPAWPYGHYYYGDRITEASIAYVTKYITKEAGESEETGGGRVLTSPGLGKSGVKKLESNKKYWRKKNGAKTAIPEYYKRIGMSDKERADAWSEILDKREAYVMGQAIKIDTREGMAQYLDAIKAARRTNRIAGYEEGGTYKDGKIVEDRYLNKLERYGKI